MGNEDFIPERESEFFNWQGLFMTGATGRYKSLGIPGETWTDLLACQTDYQNNYRIAENPKTRTSSAIERRRGARKIYERKLRIVIKGYITYNPTVTDDLRKDLKLPVHKTTHTPSPVADTVPKVKVDTSTIAHLGLHFFKASGKHRKAKPEGQHGVRVDWIISDIPPVRWEELIHSAIDTNSPLTLSFEGDQRGKTVYFALCWENTRGEKGPWTDIMSAVIP